MRIRYVDGFQVRNMFGDMDFNMAHGPWSWYRPWYIPPRETWIEKRFRNEAPAWIRYERLEQKLYRKMKDYWMVRDTIVKTMKWTSYKDITLKKFRHSGTTVRIVNGALVRKSLDYAFIMGGHHFIYPHYIPPGEIWIDRNINQKEIKYILIHETLEYNLMRRGVPYNIAHDRACTAERKSRARDGIAFFPEKNPIAPLPLYRVNGTKRKKALVVSGIHGDELSGPLSVARWLMTQARFAPITGNYSFTLIPLVNPEGVRKGTRENDASQDLNRQFFDIPKPNESWEIKNLRRFLTHKRYDFTLSLHEDLARKNGFYLYDFGNGEHSLLIKRVFRTATRFGLRLLNGLDDASLKNKVKHGYVKVERDDPAPTLEEYMVRNGKTRAALTLEIPGKMSLEKKIELGVELIKITFDSLR